MRKLYGIEDKFIVFTLRHHEPKYGIIYLIIAAKIVLSHRKDVIFIIGGDGMLRKYHIGLTDELGIRDYVFSLVEFLQKKHPYTMLQAIL